MVDDITATTINKSSIPGGPAVVREKKQVVKRDIIRKKEPVNIVFCGHVDAGKSTIGGQLM
jgi:GTPase